MSKNKLNFAFFGTPEVASTTLDILHQAGYMPKVIITTPDRRSGRGMHMSATPVAMWALKHKITCLKPEKIDHSFIKEFKKLKIDLFIVVAYGKILPEDLIDIPLLGTINIHYSLLPKYRGASPVEQALLAGDETTGVTIQQMAFILDSGPIIASVEVVIDIDETKSKLLLRLAKIGGNLLLNKLPDIFAKEITPHIQDELFATYCKKIKKEDGLLDLNTNPKQNYNKYRALEGSPGTYFFFDRNSKQIRVKIIKAKYENNLFIIERVIPEGKKEINYTDFTKSNT